MERREWPPGSTQHHIIKLGGNFTHFKEKEKETLGSAFGGKLHVIASAGTVDI